MPPVITLHYLIICSLCFLCAGWMIVKVLSEPAPAADDDDGEGFGGIPDGFVFPVFDPPGGCHLSDLLIDRLPAGTSEKPLPGPELSPRPVRTTDRRGPGTKGTRLVEGMGAGVEVVAFTDYVS